MLDACDEVIIAQSCDKNFSCYRDRVGSLFIKTGSPRSDRDRDGPCVPAGARDVVDAARSWRGLRAHHPRGSRLRARWLVELEAMRDRINSVRQRIAAADPRLSFIGKQFGMFSMLPLSKEQVLKLRSDHSIYMADSGRFNVVGMGDAQIDRFTAAVVDALEPRATMADRDPGKVSADVDWREVARLVLTSREMDRIEEEELVPAKKVLYQFSARGHDMAQVLLGLHLKDGDGGFGYYRSRPLLLSLGVPLADALGSGMGLAGGYSDGRDIGVVFNYPEPGRRARVADVRRGRRAIYAGGRLGAGDRLQAARCWARDRRTAIALVLGGDASCATGGFWSALTIATTQQLPLLIYIEDNGYGISVPSDYQTPGRDIAANLASFAGLTIFNGDGTDPVEAARLIDEAVGHVRDAARAGAAAADRAAARGAQLPGHADLQVGSEVAAEWERDPLPSSRRMSRPQIGEGQWATSSARRRGRSRRLGRKPRRAGCRRPRR